MIETKSRILQSAIEIWGKDMTYSLEDIAGHLGISRRTLHRHYQGRDDLMNSVINHVINEYLFNIQKIMQLKLPNREKLKAILEYDIKSSSKYMVFCQSRRSHSTEREPDNKNVGVIQKIMAGLFLQLVNEGIIREGLPLPWLELFYSAVVETALKSIELGIGQEKCIEIAWSSFYGGITQNEK